MNITSGILLSFLIGSIPTGYLVGRRFGTDIRSAGSGNIGATNAGRLFGKTAGLITLFGDALKGIVATAVIAGRCDLAGSTTLQECQALLAFAAVCGHCFSPFLRFRGGKGVATSLGAMLVIFPKATVVAAIGFLVVFRIFGYVSMGSITAALLLPVAIFGGLEGYVSRTAALAVVMTSALVIFRHHQNITRVLRGVEHQQQR